MSASAAVRARAARIVADVAARGRSLDAVLTFDASDTRQERGLLRSLCYDSIRWHVRLDALLDRLLARPRQALAPELRSLAIVGLCQLIYTDIPEHAAVDETVDATRLLGHPRAAGLVNALLRRCQREHKKLLAEIDRDPAVRAAHPRWLADALTADWGDRAPDILDANNQRPPLWLRVNRRRQTGAQYRAQLEAAGIKITEGRFDDETLLLEQALDVGDLPGFAEGAASVQDAAAQLAARLVASRPGDRVLDACAAPGGKTGHLLELQPELAELIAVDVSPERLTRVADNLQRLGLAQAGPPVSRGIPAGALLGSHGLPVTLIAGDAAEPAQWWDGPQFQRILLDVPCSATGVIRRHPDIKLLRRAGDVPALAERQSRMLREMWSLLAPGGRLTYASCSALQAETTAVIEAFLADCPQARDVTMSALAELGLPAQGGPGHRIAVGTAGMDGFYYASLEKTKG